MTPSWGRGLNMDGVFMDTYDTPAPNAWTDPSLPNFSKYVEMCCSNLGLGS